jgi:DNA polymerase
MYKQIVTIDAETYFSADYSLKLKRYNTSEYIRDSQFKLHCMAIKVDDAPTKVYYGDEIEEALAAIDWSNSALLAHNVSFDGFILSHHFDITPAYYLDTLSMARAVHSNSIRAGLDEVARFYKIGNKLPDVLQKTKGVLDLSPELAKQLGEYCAMDVDLCYEIYKLMRHRFIDAEMDLIDLTVRMFCDPVLFVDIPRAELALKKELEDRAALIAKTGHVEATLRSGLKFAAALESLGVNPPTKPSPSNPKKQTYAFAKNDLDLQELLEHENEAVRDLVAARLAAKSTIYETRTIRFIQAGSFRRKLPIMLNYFGAHTGRWTGGNKMNPQNLPRGGELRKSIIAPPGYHIIACDSAQIEARVLAWLADHALLLSLFASGQDVYKHQAAAIYRIPFDDVSQAQRFVGKVCTLGLGYGMGVDKFQYTLATGSMGPPVKLTIEVCREIVGNYRVVNLQIARLWSIMNENLGRMVNDIPCSMKCIEFHKDHLLIPNGIQLQYPNLEGNWDPIHEKYTEFRYYTLEEAVKKRMGLENSSRKMYGGLLVENVVQALSRVIVANQMLEIAKRYRVVMFTHDEVVCVVPDAEVEVAKGFMKEVMSTPPSWGESIPLNAEAESGKTYG